MKSFAKLLLAIFFGHLLVACGSSKSIQDRASYVDFAKVQVNANLEVSGQLLNLTDSTVLRNVGVPFAHTIIGFKSTLKGLGKLLLNQEKFEADLEANWAVVAEAIQTVLRRENYPNPYEALKGLTRTNEQINQQSIAAFIDRLEVAEAVKAELKAITPSNYTGI